MLQSLWFTVSDFSSQVHVMWFHLGQIFFVCVTVNRFTGGTVLFILT
jgi:hypothetical protein